MKTHICIGVLLLLVTILPAKSHIIGEIMFFSGEVTLYRNGQELPSIDFGLQIENLDHIRTGFNGRLEIAMYPETGVHATLILEAETVVNINFSGTTHGISSKQNPVIDLIIGTIELIVSGESNNANIRTNAVICTAHGASLYFQYLVSDDILLSVSNGNVGCNSGQMIFISPGETMEYSAKQGLWHNIPFPVNTSSSDLSAFHDEWFSNRLASLNVLETIRLNARRYLELKDRFVQAYIRLMNDREIIQKWMSEDRIGMTGNRETMMRETRQVTQGIQTIRALQLLFEQVYYRVERLLLKYSNPASTSEIAPGLSFRSFQRQFEADRSVFLRRMNETRYIAKLYALRNQYY